MRIWGWLGRDLRITYIGHATKTPDPATRPAPPSAVGSGLPVSG